MNAAFVDTSFYVALASSRDVLHAQAVQLAGSFRGALVTTEYVLIETERPDKDWSLTDCISFLVMKDFGLTDAFTADHHFEQAGFTAWLR